jgi:uridine kinase
MRIFLDAGKTTQYVLRLQRERAEFGSTESEVLVRMKKYYADYLKHIKPQAAVADLILRVRPDYGLTIARRYFVRTERGSDLLIDV